MANVLVVYHSQTGNTEMMAEAVAEGAGKVPDVEVTLKKAGEATPDDMLAADAVIMGSPVYYGTMAAELKSLIDRSVCHHGKLDGKVGAAFASSGAAHGGNETTIMDIVKALLIHGMIVQGESSGDHYGAVAVGAPDDEALDSCRRLGRKAAELTKRLAGP